MSELPLSKSVSKGEAGDRVVSALYKGHDYDVDPNSRNGDATETRDGLPGEVKHKSSTEGSATQRKSSEAQEAKVDEASTSLSSSEGSHDEKEVNETNLTDGDLEKGHNQNGSAPLSKHSSKKEVANTPSAALSTTQEVSGDVDPNIVDFDGPDDPTNARNWSKKKKWGNIAVIASATFLTPLASSMFAPGVPEVMSDFKSSNEELASFVVSVYVLGYAFGPLILAPLSEMYGRAPLYYSSNIGFVIFSIACAASKNLNTLIGMRFIAGLFGSCPLTIGGGTIADMFAQEERGGVMAVWTLGPLMGPVLGPVAGGYLAQAAGWRWVFWVIAIAAGVIATIAFVFVQETYPVVILERKAKRLRKETGNPNLRSKMALPYPPKQLFKISILRPLKMIAFSPIVFLLSLYVAIVYGYLYLLFTTLTPVFESTYHFSAGSVGLTYLGIGIGSLFGVIIFGFLSDKILNYLTKKHGGEAKPEYRLPPLIPGSLFLPIGLFLYGWTSDKAVHWIAPIVGTSLVGFGLLATFMPVLTYLVDAFTIYSASALAANTIFRSLFGALLPLAGRKMYQALGLGWGNSLLGFIALACFPVPIIFYRYGEQIRTKTKVQF